ncbi:MAG TPA: YqaJ viral recombinase family protein [Acidobacteriaceae bacterium]|jgi:putative phage-type endonuclease|nr:YqaJ viral recombinase family protein [Acidobacteriaceae bacterium]
MSAPISIGEQHSPEWMAARRGIVTASRCGDVINFLKKGGESADRRSYRNDLVVALLTGLDPYRYVSAEMQWGLDQEPFARAAYEMAQDVMVETCGLVLHPKVPRFGASPDGLVGDDGLIQIKCPNTATHLGWMLTGQVPSEHGAQMLAEMACTGREWNDFVSFDPRLPKHLQLFIKRWHRDDALISQLEVEVARFNSEIDDVLDQLPQEPRAGKGQPVVNILDYMPRDEVSF